jgi:hypothetical protein
VLVGACVGGGVGVGVWGEGGSCHEMAWGGMRGGPCPSIYSHGGGIRGRDERISGRLACRAHRMTPEAYVYV